MSISIAVGAWPMATTALVQIIDINSLLVVVPVGTRAKASNSPLPNWSRES
jgi:hypothetical protein